MGKASNKVVEKLCDDIYENLKIIQEENELGLLGMKALIADCLSQKLYDLGYRLRGVRKTDVK